MRILLLTQFFQPEPMFKGLAFAKELRDLGHDVEVITGFPNYPGGRLYPGYKIRLWQREVIDSIPVTRLALFPSHDQSGLRRVANYLSFGASAALLAPILIRPPDVVYVYNLITLGLAARLIRFRHRCRIVLDVQDLWPESVLKSGMLRSRWIGGVLRRWCRWEYASPDRITVLSPGFKGHFVSQGIPAARIEVIYNWFDEAGAARSGDEAEQLRQKLGFIGRFNVLFAGTMGKMQALDTVVTAAGMIQQKAPEVLFTFMGGGVEVEHLKALSAGLTNVQFIPRCSYQEAMAVTSAADAVIVHLKNDPLFSITIPSKTQAYLYAGKPILMGVPGDAAALVREAQAGLFFEPEDPSSLAAAVCELSRMPLSEREQMGARGKRFYEEHLSFAKGVRHFEAVFREVCGEKVEPT
jgi:glycosyltransferase involved in cell wall biosynthesis